MSQTDSLRLLIDPPLAGDVNMAIDEVLLNSAHEGIATLRFYQWDQATVSLGHFQAAQGQFVPPQFSGLPVVKRLSGGGAILHHHELTYSCALPAGHPILKEPGELYDLVHDEIIAVLTGFQVAARLRGEDAFTDQSFLCFARGDARDIVMDVPTATSAMPAISKIVGSAQRRRRGAVLQHGSVLLQKSDWAEEFPGIFELSHVRLTCETLQELLAPKISARLGLPLSCESLNAQEQHEVNVAALKYRLAGDSRAAN